MPPARDGADPVLARVPPDRTIEAVCAAAQTTTVEIGCRGSGWEAFTPPYFVGPPVIIGWDRAGPVLGANHRGGCSRGVVIERVPGARHSLPPASRWITEDEPGRVTLKVSETGFAGMPGTDLDRRSRYEDHDGGWTHELGLAKAELEKR